MFDLEGYASIGMIAVMVSFLLLVYSLIMSIVSFVAKKLIRSSDKEVLWINHAMFEKEKIDKIFNGSVFLLGISAIITLILLK